MEPSSGSLPGSLPGARRQYNAWVAADNVEDFALRYWPPDFRRWSALLLGFGFQNAFWGMMLALVINVLAGLPIAYYAARYNVDADLITRGAGFGYVGSTVTSLVYAAFCFITFALQASIMAGALQMPGAAERGDWERQLPALEGAAQAVLASIAQGLEIRA